MAARKNVQDIKLNPDQIEKLIELYQTETDLWDVDSPVYFKKEFRKMCLQRICQNMEQENEELQCTVDQIQAKLSYLRGYYSRELAKEMKSRKRGATADDVYKSKWAHFKSMDAFMRRQITPRSLHSNLDASTSSHQDECDTDLDNDETSSHTYEVPLEDYIPLKKKSKGRKSSPEEVMSDAVSVLKDLTKDKEEKKTDALKDEDEIFGQYITTELHKITDSKLKAIVKFRLQYIIFEAQMGNLQGGMYGTGGYMGLFLPKQCAPTVIAPKTPTQPTSSPTLPPLTLQTQPQQSPPIRPQESSTSNFTSSDAIKNEADL